MKREGLLLVISGPAGSGKGTVVNCLLNKSEDFVLSVSATSRGRAKTETEGVEYFFKTREEFEEMIRQGDLLEYTEYCGNYYGTPRKRAEDLLATGKNVLLEIDVDGGRQIKNVFPEALLIMIIPPSAREQENRLRTRGRDSEESIQKRLKRAREEILLLDGYDYVVVNENGAQDKTAESLLAICEAEQCSARRNRERIKNSFFED